jgi:recombination protein RecA
MAATTTSSAASAASASSTKEKDKALATAISQIDRKFGKGSIMRMGEDSTRLAIASIPTGSISLDIALGVGGVPRGRVIEVYGPESSGKTTLAQHIIAEAQKMGGTAAFIDAEHAFDPVYAARCGVKTSDLLMSQPDTGEQALEICNILVHSNAVDVVVIDSVAALVPRAEIEGEMGDSLTGAQARLMSQALRKLSGAINKSHTSVVFLNQLRMKIGVMFGSPETTTGGQALKFYSSVRMDIRRIEVIRRGDETIGMRSRVKVVKNKVAPPFRQAEFDIMANEGISHESGLLDIGLRYEILRKSGSWFYFGDEQIGQGKENVKTFLREHPDISKDIDERIRKVAFDIPTRPYTDDDETTGEAFNGDDDSYDDGMYDETGKGEAED